MPRRIVFDIRTLIESQGSSDGIVRTVRALASYASKHRRDVVFAIFDPEHGAFRALRPEWTAAVMDGAKVDTSHFADTLSPKQRLREKLPLRLRRVALAIQRPRRRAFLKVTGWTLNRRRPSRLLDGMLSVLKSEKYRQELADTRGGQRLLLPFETAMSGTFTLDMDDVVFLAGSDWSAMHRIATVVAADSRRPKLAVLCYDIIPLMFPQFFRPHDSARFRECFHGVFPVSDLVILNTQRIQTDVVAYCRDHALSLARTAVIGLGTDFGPVAADAKRDLPNGVLSGRYALFVSTIEPRKNHRLLFEVWKKLLDEGVPQAHDFKMVFVGKPGWLVDDLIREMNEDACCGNSLLMLSGISDEMLHALYADAAFCLYPSFYEGFGLPIIEAFRYGKAVIASTGGALLEVVGHFSPSVDPADADEWFAILKRWIEVPAERTAYETLIRRDFRPRDWNTAASDIFDAVSDLHDEIAA